MIAIHDHPLTAPAKKGERKGSALGRRERSEHQDGDGIFPKTKAGARAIPGKVRSGFPSGIA
ncbi:hypothetical protein FJ958_20805 [Mesorhizobium sp. B2-3-5]|nr:hypothetical protein FJ958_20805 [Mesorhizobium sp. B2-3-5]